MTKTAADREGARLRRAFWLKHLHRWHWISSAVCLLGMLLFAATGLTLNNAARIEAKPRVSTQSAHLPAPLLVLLNTEEHAAAAPVPAFLRDWLVREMALDVGGGKPEWSAGELYVALPRPGGDAWLSVDLDAGEVTYERTDRGWISYFNDLHKGRNTGTAWSWFLDLFSVACLVFAVTGLFLLQMHAGSRPATWPMVGLGLVLPLVLAILFIH